MKVRQFILASLFSGLQLFFIGQVFAQSPVPPGQDPGSQMRRVEGEKKLEAFKEKISEDEVEVEGEEEVSAARPEAGVQGGEIVRIDRIEVEGATILKPEKVREAVSEFEGRDLSLDQFQEAAESVTDIYRSLGYATSFAFVPPQKIENNVLRLEVREGRVGKIVVSGNKHFKTKRLLRYIEMVQGDTFNYDELRQDVARINEHRDRSGRVVLDRGELPGETDVNIEIQDQFPWHVTLGYNNYNSRFVERNRYSMELQATNFLGFDDILTGEIQLGEAGQYQLYSARYVFPITDKIEAGISYIHLDQELGRSVSEFDIKGDGDIISTYLSFSLIETENFSLSFNPGFDYKDIDNNALGRRVSEDNVRILKLGFDADLTDGFRGRTVLTQEFDFGLENFLGGLDREDPIASRAGAGGRFFKSTTNLGRVQAMPFSTVMLLRGGMQLSNYTLPSTEQYQVGGFYTVRGYPVSDQSGDNGLYFSAEYHVPPVFLPKEWKIPFTDTSYREAISFLGFFDWGYVSNNSPKLGETKDEHIYSAGFGIRFNIMERASVSFDYGFALGQEASDGSDSRGYIETKLFF